MAVFVRVAAQPGAGALAGVERISIELRGFVERARLSALAAHEEIGEVARGAALVQPELSPTGASVAVHETPPVEIIDVAPGTGAHEARGHHLEPFEEPPLVQRLAMHQTP